MCLSHLLIESNVIILHNTPVSPSESYLWWSTIDFQHLPCKCRHHSLESLVAAGKVGVLRAVVLIRGDNSVICADLKHMLARLWWASIDRECIVRMVDRTPIGKVCLE